jgi:ADP-heptose:LPS heptosyltransferase
MDLVITVDTMIAHLAGTLGKPVWLLLAHPADWRWMMDRGDSPWYPAMRIFRQKPDGGWDSVISEVCRSLTGAAYGSRIGAG